MYDFTGFFENFPVWALYFETLVRTGLCVFTKTSSCVGCGALQSRKKNADLTGNDVYEKLGANTGKMWVLQRALMFQCCNSKDPTRKRTESFTKQFFFSRSVLCLTYPIVDGHLFTTRTQGQTNGNKHWNKDLGKYTQHHLTDKQVHDGIHHTKRNHTLRVPWKVNFCSHIFSSCWQFLNVLPVTLLQLYCFCSQP